MKIVTDRVFPDEPCYGLFEGRENGRWIQRLWVIRDDRKAQYVTDLGPVSAYPDATPVIWYSDGDDTVAELQHHAERDRHDNKWAKRRRELQSESTLIADIIRQEEEMIQIRRNRSRFGPLISIQRNDFPIGAVQNRKKERRQNGGN